MWNSKDIIVACSFISSLTLGWDPVAQFGSMELTLLPKWTPSISLTIFLIHLVTAIVIRSCCSTLEHWIEPLSIVHSIRINDQMPKLSYWARFLLLCLLISLANGILMGSCCSNREGAHNLHMLYISNLFQRHNLHVLILFLVQAIARFPVSCEVSSFGIIFTLRDWNVNKGAFADYPNNCRAWKTQNNMTITLAA